MPMCACNSTKIVGLVMSILVPHNLFLSFRIFSYMGVIGAVARSRHYSRVMGDSKLQRMPRENYRGGGTVNERDQYSPLI